MCREGQVAERVLVEGIVGQGGQGVVARLAEGARRDGRRRRDMPSQSLVDTRRVQALNAPA
jgi:hypothetical protein